MSDLSKINEDLRLEAIRAALVHHPSLLKLLLNKSGDSMDLKSTPEHLDCDEPEDILARIAWDIWNGTGETEFDKVLHHLSMDDFHAFLEAMKIFGRLRDKIYSAYASGSEDD